VTTGVRQWCYSMLFRRGGGVWTFREVVPKECD
jgi:hypothetical protein